MIREHIAAGLIRPGARLPEEPIAESLGIPRNTLREALSQLLDRYLVTAEQHLLSAYPQTD